MGIISLKSVSKSYPSADSRLNVLNEVNLEIKKGEFTVVSGPSGSGKSTLFNLIGALDQPDSGTIRIDDTDIAGYNGRELADMRNEKIGFIFQFFHLVPVLTALENVAWPLFVKGVRSQQRMAQSSELLRKVGLASHMNRRPGQLSGGQCQRVAIARALACEPQIILADEPTGNLDRKTALEIMDLFASLNLDEQVTFVLSTHDPVVVSYANRCLLLADGKIGEGHANPTLNVGIGRA